MESTVKYPVGIQTFSEIIEEDYMYVDKTELIYKLVNGGKYMFLSRPRRFGKSLLASTLEAYFLGKCELFRGLAIDRLEKDWTVYPVFRFDLSGANYSDLERLYARIKGCLDSIERRYGLSTDTEIISERFIHLIEQAAEKTGKRVVIIIDEYDKPMLDTLHDVSGLHEKIRDELRGFYSAIKLSDEFVKFAFITGVTRFSRLSIFSGFNNLKDISLAPAYAEICGISSRELHLYFGASIRDFATRKGWTDERVRETLKYEYDGYRFAIPGVYVYNPFSVLSAFDSDSIGQFWYATGSSSFLVELVKHRHFLLGNLEGVKRHESDLNDITEIGHDVVPLLYQAGYLTLKDYDESSKEYILGFPNHEVSVGFWRSLAKYFFINRIGESSFDVGKFLDDVYRGQPDSFMKRLQTLFADTESGAEPDKEIHFQNMMATVFKMLGLMVHTEMHSSLGRCDMTVETPSYIYIFEFKVDGSAEAAMRQIHERDYAGRWAMDSRSVFLIGANFSTRLRNLSVPWIIEQK